LVGNGVRKSKKGTREMNNEPVAWMLTDRVVSSVPIEGAIPLYTHPAKTFTLTTDEIFDIWDEHTDYDGNFISDIDTFVLAILRKAQEK
jgi:hypothetical protein